MTVVMVEDLDPASADAGVPAHYGDPMREQRVLEEGLAVVDLSHRSVLTVSARLRHIAAEGAMVLVATHDLDLADGLVTRVALMREGRLLSDEPAPAGIRARYREVVGGL